MKNVKILILIVSNVFKYFRKKNAPSKNDGRGETEERKNGEKKHPWMNNWKTT